MMQMRKPEPGNRKGDGRRPGYVLRASAFAKATADKMAGRRPGSSPPARAGGAGQAAEMREWGKPGKFPARAVEAQVLAAQRVVAVRAHGNGFCEAKNLTFANLWVYYL